MGAADGSGGHHTDAKKAKKYVGLGTKLMEEGKYGDALGMFEKALSFDPNDTLAKLYRARSLSGLDRGDDAYDAVDAVLQSHPEMDVTYVVYAGDLMVSLKEYDRALELGERAARLDPTFTYSFHTMARVMMLVGRADDAKKYLDEALRHAPDDYTNYLDYVHNVMYHDEYALAVLYLNRLIRMNHNVEAAYSEKINVFYMMKKYQSALKACDAALEMFPSNYDAHVTRGRIFQIMGKLSDAQKAAKAAAAIKPREAYPYEILYDIMVAQGDYEKALKYNTRAIRNDPDNYNLKRDRCSIILDMGRNKDAIAAAKSISGIHDDDPLPNFVTSTALFRMGRYDEALSAIKKALKSDSKHASSHHHMGLILMCKKKSKDALKCLETAHELDSQNTHIPLNMAMAMSDLGKYDEASEYIERAEKMGADPEHIAIYRERIDSYRRGKSAIGGFSSGSSKSGSGNGSGGKSSSTKDGHTRWKLGRSAAFGRA